ncbi:hypothetical protein FB45DRAFT_946615 [Roridomyces roridus]|uniref:F-box domain-containing protein n=1 Tax=Roridomyces roridus TaxID=1738132 RepID=A0AAD7F8B8_9AGAR|nr:hypothetical protein FB45DRAFT_946615 [Roridomyces roridus]
MDALPPELWLACWSFLSRRQLPPISLVCKHFRSLCLPLLFAHQTADLAAIVRGIASTSLIERTHRLNRLALRLEGLAQPPYTLLVRSWSVRFVGTMGGPGEGRTVPRFFVLAANTSPSGIFDSLRDRVASQFLKSLGLYRNLVSLEMQSVLIDEGVRTALGSLEHLEELRIDWCDVKPSDGVLLQLKRFTNYQSAD